MISFLNKWVIWRIIPSLMWACIPLGISIAIWPEYVQGKLLWLGLLPIAALFYILFRNGIKSALLYGTLLLTYPAIAGFWIIIKSYRPVLSFGRFSIYITNPIMFIGYVFALFIVSALLYFSTSSAMIYALTFIGICGNICLIIIALRWATSPTKILDGLSSFMESMQKSVVKKPEDEEKKTKKKPPTAEDIRVTQYVANKAISIMSKAEKNVPTIMTAVFIIAIFSLTILSVINFASIYCAYRKIDPAAYQGMGGTYADAMMYSFSVITTSPIGNVQVSSQFEQFIYCAQLACTVLLITMFVSLFSIGIGLQQEKMSNFAVALNKFRIYVHDETSKHIGSQKREYETALHQGTADKTNNIEPEEETERTTMNDWN